jgi:hypothetical protein
MAGWFECADLDGGVLVSLVSVSGNGFTGCNGSGMRTEHCLFLCCWWNAYPSKQRLPFPLVFHIPVRTAHQTRSLTTRTESEHNHLGSRSHAVHPLLLLRLLVSRLLLLSALCR